MEQEDYLKRQIDQLGRVLGKILADLMELKAQGQVGGGMEAASQALKNELGLNIDELTTIPAEKFITRIRVGRQWSISHPRAYVQLNDGSEGKLAHIA